MSTRHGQNVLPLPSSVSVEISVKAVYALHEELRHIICVS